MRNCFVTCLVEIISPCIASLILILAVLKNQIPISHRMRNCFFGNPVGGGEVEGDMGRMANRLISRLAREERLNKRKKLGRPPLS
jgi:hypothetical protein